MSRDDSVLMESKKDKREQTLQKKKEKFGTSSPNYRRGMLFYLAPAYPSIGSAEHGSDVTCIYTRLKYIIFGCIVIGCIVYSVALHSKGVRGKKTKVLSEESKLRKRIHSKAYDKARGLAKTKGYDEESRAFVDISAHLSAPHT